MSKQALYAKTAEMDKVQKLWRRLGDAIGHAFGAVKLAPIDYDSDEVKAYKEVAANDPIWYLNRELGLIADELPAVVTILTEAKELAAKALPEGYTPKGESNEL